MEAFKEFGKSNAFDVIDAFKARAPETCRVLDMTVWTDGHTIYVGQTCLAVRAEGKVVLNFTKYENKCRRYVQSLLRHDTMDYDAAIYEMPVDTDDAALFAEAAVSVDEVIEKFAALIAHGRMPPAA